MEPRRVVIELEVKTDVKLDDLRRAKVYIVRVVPSGGSDRSLTVIEARANVIRDERKRHRR